MHEGGGGGAGEALRHGAAAELDPVVTDADGIKVGTASRGAFSLPSELCVMREVCGRDVLQSPL